MRYLSDEHAGSAAAVAAVTGVSESTVRRWRAGVDVRDTSGRPSLLTTAEEQQLAELVKERAGIDALSRNDLCYEVRSSVDMMVDKLT